MISTKYNEIYKEFIKKYEDIHVNPWHEISKKELNEIYNMLINNMDITNEFSFKYFMDYILKRLSGKSDAHTKYNRISPIPMNFRIFGDTVLINYPKELKNQRLISINGIDIKDIIDEMDEVITYGTNGKKIYELEKSLFNRVKLFGLPSLRNNDRLNFLIEDEFGTTTVKTYEKYKDYKEEMFDYNKYFYGEPGIYEIINETLIYRYSSCQNIFHDRIKKSIEKLKTEDMSKIDKIIVDVRGNTGGNSMLNKYLMEFLEENKGKIIICLTDYRVFSAGRYALIDLINLGAITMGEEISTQINCYGNSNNFSIGEMKFSVSDKYFNPSKNYQASSKEDYQNTITEELKKPYIFRPDIQINETIDDYINEQDSILQKAMGLNIKNLKIKTNFN